MPARSRRRSTHRDLKQMLTRGEFREDLYYRIDVVQLRVPPLRERREDILGLSRLFLGELAGKGEMSPVLTPAAEEVLLNYPWPWNIRELRNALERARLLTDGRSIGIDHLFERTAPAFADVHNNGTLRDYLSECERDFIVRALENSHWQIQSCADAFGISRKNLWEKTRKLGVDREGGEIDRTQ